MCDPMVAPILIIFLSGTSNPDFLKASANKSPFLRLFEYNTYIGYFLSGVHAQSFFEIEFIPPLILIALEDTFIVPSFSI